MAKSAPLVKIGLLYLPKSEGGRQYPFPPCFDDPAETKTTVKILILLIFAGIHSDGIPQKVFSTFDNIFHTYLMRGLRQYCHPFSDVSGNTYLLFVKGNIGRTPERSEANCY
jgi:hypothetical protein